VSSKDNEIKITIIMFGLFSSLTGRMKLGLEQPANLEEII